MKHYKPNFSDPRVHSRAIQALDWVNQYASRNNNTWFSSREIDRQMGNQSRPLGRWLKFKLLICSVSYYDAFSGQCKQYRLNPEGYQEVCGAVGHEPRFKITAELEQQFVSGDFEYESKSDRLFASAQFIPKPERRAILENHGYLHHYDVEAAAPTLLLQQALKLSPQSKDLFPSLRRMIGDRSLIRNQIAQEADCDPSEIKFLINCLLQGAVLTTSRFSSIPQRFSFDLIKRLQVNTTLCEIRNEIRYLWSILREDMPVRYLTDRNGRTRRRALSGRDKSGYYRALEDQVGRVVRKHLKKNSLRYLWIHDGWSCDHVIDDQELIGEVMRSTGFRVKLDKETFDTSY